MVASWAWNSAEKTASLSGEKTAARRVVAKAVK